MLLVTPATIKERFSISVTVKEKDRRTNEIKRMSEKIFKKRKSDRGREERVCI